MLYWWIVPVALLSIPGLAYLLAKRADRRKTLKVNWIAHSEQVTQVPRYRQLVRNLRLSARLRGLLVLALICVTALMAGLPVHRDTYRQSDVTRDIIFCLDVSGSMISTDQLVVGSLRDLAKRFDGERVALHAWNASDVTVFPLTDDYDLILEELDHLYRLLGEFREVPGKGVLVSEELAQFLEQTDPIADEGSSLIGDGVASCALGFPEHDDGRARWMIVATDNEPQGDSIYDLVQAIDLAKSRDVTVFGIYYHNSDIFADAFSDDEAKKMEEEYRTAVESSGGKLFEVSDANSVEEILDDINSRGIQRGKGRLITTETDANKPYIIGLYLLVSTIVTVAGVSRQ